MRGMCHLRDLLVCGRTILQQTLQKSGSCEFDTETEGFMKGRVFPIQHLQFVTFSLLRILLRLLCFLNKERGVEQFWLEY
jgi:hypothetical protein